MTFVSALFLLGALGVAGPIVVHLLARPKFKRLPFTMLQFLREGQSESQARRRLRDWVILMLRCLIIALIALLFARPVWETRAPRPASQAVWFVGLDNSLSMTYHSQGRDLLTQLKTQAKDVIRDCADDAEFHLFLAADNQWHRHMTKAQALAIVHAMKPGESLAQFGDFLGKIQRTRQTLSETSRLNVLLGSDFSSDVMMGLRGLVTRVKVDHLMVLPVMPDPDSANVGIVSASVSAVDPCEAQIHVTVRNTGPRTATRSLTIRARSHDPKDMTLNPNMHRVCALTCPLSKTFGSQKQTITIALNGSDDFKADDEIQLTIKIPDQTVRRVLLVDQDTTDRLFLFKTAIESLTDVSMGVAWETRCVTVDQMTPVDLDWADTLVLAGMGDALPPWIESFKSFVARGKRLVCFMTDVPGPAIISKIDQSEFWPVIDIERTASSGQPESQAIGCEWTHRGAGESLTQYGLDRMVLRGSFRGSLVSEAQCAWRLKNGDPFVAIHALGQGVTLWVNTSVDGSLSALAKSPAAVAWAQFLLESGQGSNRSDTHDPWRDHEPVVRPVSLESIEAVTDTLFHEAPPLATEAAAPGHVTKQWPLWRPTAWLLLLLLLVEPFVAERMKP